MAAVSRAAVACVGAFQAFAFIPLQFPQEFLGTLDGVGILLLVRGGECHQGNAGFIVAVSALGDVDAAILLDEGFQMLQAFLNRGVILGNAGVQQGIDGDSGDAHGLGRGPTAIIRLRGFEVVHPLLHRLLANGFHVLRRLRGAGQEENRGGQHQFEGKL
jgi:hypothetical protein